MATTYIALRTQDVGERIVQRGDLVPEARDWPRIKTWLDRGYVEAVPEEGAEARAADILAADAAERTRLELHAEQSVGDEAQFWQGLEEWNRIVGEAELADAVARAEEIAAQAEADSIGEIADASDALHTTGDGFTIKLDGSIKAPDSAGG